MHAVIARYNPELQNRAALIVRFWMRGLVMTVRQVVQTA